MSTVYLSLGSNLDNRFNNLRIAIEQLSKIVKVTDKSIVMETEAILPENAPAEWNKPYLNMVLVAETELSPRQLLSEMQDIEIRMGRPKHHEKWSPRIIDIDILLYEGQVIRDTILNIPHPGISSRPFLKNLLNFVGYDSVDFSEYNPLNTYALDPKLIGIVNVTPDSFSDGGDYFSPEKAVQIIEENLNNGAYVAELGAQSTRPGYVEVSAAEEINRLSMVLDHYNDTRFLGVDTYFDAVVMFCLAKGIRWINDIKGNLSDSTIKAIADNGATLVTMLTGMNVDDLIQKVDYLTNLGMPRDKVIIDPGLGFGKKKYENLLILRELSRLKDTGLEILLGHSRKSFFRLFSSASVPAKELDIETITLSLYANVDYLRIHNVKSHTKALVAQNIGRRFIG